MTKPKSKDVSPNKLSEDELKRAEQIQERLMNQGIGRDEAWHRAVQEAADEVHSGEGGGSSSGGGAGNKSGGS